MNLFYANGTPVINSLKIQSEVPLDPRLNPETIEERDSLVTKHIAYDRMKVYVKETDSEYVYHKDKNEWVILSKFEKEEKDKLENIKNYLVDTEIIYDKDNNLLYREHSYDPNTNITSLRDYSIPEATVLGDGTLYNGLLSKFYVNRLNNVTGYQTDAKITSDTETESLFLTVTKYNPDTDESVTTNLNIPLVTDDNNGLVSPEKKHWMDNADGLSNTGTTSQTWQLQKSDIDTRLDPNGGVIIKNSGGKLEVRNNQDNSYAPVTLGDIIIEGNVTQKGESFITQAEIVEVRDNTILLNRGETAAGVSKGFAGIEIDRGTLPKFQILFDESDRRFKAGEEGDLWCLALKDDDADMLNGMFTSWDSSTKRLKTTNIIPSDRKLAFTDNNSYLQLTSHSFSGDALSQTLRYSNSLGGIFISAGNTNLNLDTDKTSFYFHKNILLPSTISSVSDFLFKRSNVTKLSLKDTVAQFTVPVTAITFNRASDGSEVLYHADIVNNLTSGGVNKVLSAEQGKLLNNAIKDIRGTYLPLTGGTMSGSIRFPVGLGIVCKDVSGSAAYNVLRTWNYNGSTRMYVGTVNLPTYISSTASDLIHDRNGYSYLLWDSFNLKDPAILSGNNTFTGNNTFQAGKFNVGPFGVTSSGSLLSNISSPAGSSWSGSITFRANSDPTSDFIFGGFNSINDTSIGYAYIGIGNVRYNTAQYKFYSNQFSVSRTMVVPESSFRIFAGNSTLFYYNQSEKRVQLGGSDSTISLELTANNVYHSKYDLASSTWKKYIIYSEYNLPNPVASADLANYLPLAGGTLTGQLTIKQNIDIKLRLQSTDADNYCIIQAISAQASQLGVLGYAGDKWAIGHGGTYYEIWDKYNLTNPVTYTTNAYNHATLTNKDGQYFTYIKAGTNGLLPHSKATLTSGGSGSLGTSDQSFNAAYINNLHTNKVTFGDAGPYIAGSTSAIQFLNAEGGVQKVATGGLYVGPSYASDALNLVPANGIYSQGNIKTSGWLTFEDNEWTNTGWAYKEAKGSIKVLSVINETENKPTTNGSVFQFNSRQGYWCTQIWCDQTNVAGVIGTLRFRTTKSFNSTEWNPWTAIATEDYVNNRSVSWSNITGKPRTYTPSDHNHKGLQIEDNRDVTMLPNSMGSTTLRTFFNANNMPTSDWYSGIHISGWATNYAAWQLCGPSSNNTTTASSLYFRSGKDGTWNSWKKVAFTSDIPTSTSHLTNDSGFITSSALNGYATQSWANGQFASLSLYNTTSGYSTIRTAGNEICIGNTAATSASNQMLVNYRIPSGCTYAPASWVWRAGSGSSYAAGYWGNLYMNGNLVATQTWSNSQYPLKTGAGASGTWDINISGNASTASAASKLGSTTIGGSAKPIYLSSGTPTACSATVGSATVPVYMNAGTITQCSTTLGVSITGNAATATTSTKWNGYDIWVGTKSQLPSSRSSTTIYIVTDA